METGRTFVIDGRKRIFGFWFVTLLAIVLMLFLFFKGENVSVELGIVVAVHVLTIKPMTTKIIMDEKGVCYKSLFFGKCFEWKEIADCGIVSKKHGVRCGYESEYTVYFSCKKDMGGKAARYMLFDGVRVSVKKSEVESIACELRTYGREYAKLEPYISEYWE